MAELLSALKIEHRYEKEQSFHPNNCDLCALIAEADVITKAEGHE
jgi:hypothetical protein